MRRPRSALFATSLAVGLGLSAPIAMAQQRPGNAPATAPAGDASSSPTTVDPMIASRSARTLLRNGLDYLNYQEYEKALTYLRAAEARPKELTSDELAKLSQGIDQARRGLREPNRGRAPVTTAKATRKVGSPLRDRDPEPIELTSATRVLPPRAAEPVNDVPDLPEVAQAAPAPAVRQRGQVPNMPPKPFANPATRPQPAPAPAPTPEPMPVVQAEPEVPPLDPPTIDVAATRDEPAPSPIPAAEAAPELPKAPTVDPELIPAQAPAAIGATPAIPLATAEDEPAGPAEPPDPLPTRVEAPPSPPSIAPAAEARTAPSNRMPSRTPPADFRYPPLPGDDAPAPIPAQESRPAPRTTPVAAASPAPSQVATRTAQGRSASSAPAPAADEIELPPLPPSALTGNSRVRNIPPELPPLPRDGQANAATRHDDLPPDVRAQIAMIEKRQEEELRQYGPGGPPRGDDYNYNLPGEATSRLILPRPPSPTEARPIKAIPTPDDIPVLSPRDWTPTRKYWAAAATCHGPLYFQDAALERYGQSVEQSLGPIGKFFSYPIDDPRQSNQRRQILQPFASIGLFAFQIAAWPINAVLDPPSEPEYDLGYYRPGDRIPPDTIYLPFTGVGPALRGSHYP